MKREHSAMKLLPIELAGLSEFLNLAIEGISNMV